MRQALQRILREAKEQHTRHDPNLPEHEWEDWYAVYVASRLRDEAIAYAIHDANQAIKLEKEALQRVL